MAIRAPWKWCSERKRWMPMTWCWMAAYGERIIPFDREDPTSEVMARVIFNVARHALEKARENPGEYPVRACVELERVRVWETSSSWAEYGE